MSSGRPNASTFTYSENKQKRSQKCITKKQPADSSDNTRSNRIYMLLKMLGVESDKRKPHRHYLIGYPATFI